MLTGYDILIVDGYNVIHQWLEMKFLKPGELDYTRQQLITILSSIVGFWGFQCLLVFDAHLVNNGKGSTEQINNNLQVIFTPEKQTADNLIERLAVEFCSQNISVLVCTSDKAEQNIVLSLGANRISARELLREVKLAQCEMKRHYGRHPKTQQRSWLEDSLPLDIKEALRHLREKK
ncbi:MAG: NYN domain-containing protein [Firmicutes bacterium]|nr:NYN domain-containing protein [Bacillota bacterium]